MLSARAGLNEEQLRQVLQVIDSGVQVWDREGKLVYANPATWRHLDLAPETDITAAELLSRCRDEHGQLLPASANPVSQVLATGYPGEEMLARVGEPGTSAGRWLEIRAVPLQAGASLAAVAFTHDVTTLKAEGLELEQQAHYDALTGLPNRMLFADRIQIALAHARRRGEHLAVCMLDLDDFKPVNDTYGHKAGDRLLQEIALRIQDCLRQEDTCARLGGDEFALLIGGFQVAVDVEHILQRLLHSITAPVYLDGQAVRVSASIGATVFPGDAQDPDQLLRHADQAMYRAKEDGRNRFHIFDPAIATQARAKQGLLRKIETALAQNQFVLYYQPKVDCRAGRVVGLEALIRWQHPVLGLRSPGEFLPLVEHDELIIQIGEWVVATALDQMAAWGARDILIPVSVNISARHFLRGNFRERLGSILERHAPSLLQRLEIEIVETAALEDINVASELIKQYRHQGISFALDDFGTGYSSLLHLKRLAVNTLKIDQTFVRDMLDDPGDLAIVQGIVGLAAAFHEHVVAEGVESIEQILMLLELGCDVMQGYGIARPMTADKVPEWLAAFKADPRWQATAGGYPLRSEFELLLVEVAHRHWLERLLATAPEIDTQDVPAADYGACRLTHWHNGTGRQRYGQLPEFRHLDEAHRRVHRLAENFLAGRLAGSESHPARAALVAANQELIAMLHNFRVILAAQGGH